MCAELSVKDLTILLSILTSPNIFYMYMYVHEAFIYIFKNNAICTKLGTELRENLMLSELKQRTSII